MNFLSFPFELSPSMCNNVLVSATAGEKRSDSAEIWAYSSNQNSHPQLTSACVALWRSAQPQSARVMPLAQRCRCFGGRFVFFPS